MKIKSCYNDSSNNNNNKDDTGYQMGNEMKEKQRKLL